jgi:hypothetical protein
MKYLRSAPLILCLLAISMTSYAHRDQRMTLDRAGHIYELPAELKPVAVRASFSRGAGPTRLKSFRLMTPKGHTDLHSCLLERIKSASLQDVEFKGSWYHEEKYTPYYIVASFFAANDFTELRVDGTAYRKDFAFPYFEVLFDLRLGKILSAEQFTPTKPSEICSDGTFACGPLGTVVRFSGTNFCTPEPIK